MFTVHVRAAVSGAPTERAHHYSVIGMGMYPGMLDRENRTGKDDEVKMAAQLGELPVQAQEKYKEQMKTTDDSSRF